MKRAIYDILYADQFLVLLRDSQHTGCPSITTDAERVTREVYEENECQPWTRILYRDTQGDIDELCHVRGVFRGFAPFSHPKGGGPRTSLEAFNECLERRSHDFVPLREIRGFDQMQKCRRCGFIIQASDGA